MRETLHDTKQAEKINLHTPYTTTYIATKSTLAPYIATKPKGMHYLDPFLRLHQGMLSITYVSPIFAALVDVELLAPVNEMVLEQNGSFSTSV